MIESFQAFLTNLSGTLTYSDMYPDMRDQPMPGVQSVLTYLRNMSIPIRVISKQSGVLMNYYQERIASLHPDWERVGYPDVMQVAKQLSTAMDAVGLKYIYVSIWDKDLLHNLTPVVGKIPLDSATPQYRYVHETPSPEFTASVQQVSSALADSLKGLLAYAGLNAYVSWHKSGSDLIAQAANDLCIRDRGLVVCCGDMRTGDHLDSQNAGCQFLKNEDLLSLLAS